MSALSRLGLGAALLGSLAAPAGAQASVGLKAGLNTSFFSGDDANDSGARLGFVGGLTTRYAVNPAVAVQLEALYSQKGESLDGDVLDPGRDYTIDTRISYLEVPVSLRFGVPLSPLLDAGVSVGGYVGIPVSSEVSADGDVPRGIQDDIDDLDVEANTDYGALIGVDLGSGPFFVDARYTLGLADVTDFDPVFGEGTSGDGLDRKNQVVSFTLGYRFGGNAPRGRRY